MNVLLWLPVIMLPASNLLSLFFSPVSSSPRILLFSLIGAVAEELFYRFFLLKTIFLRKLNSTLAILLVSVLFAGMHLFNLRTGAVASAVVLQCFCAFCFSIWAGAVVWRKGSVLIPIIAHVLLNLTALTTTPWIISLVVSIVVLLDGLTLMKGTGHYE